MPRYYEPVALTFSDSPVTVIDEYLSGINVDQASKLVREVYNSVFYFQYFYNRDASPIAYLGKVIDDMDTLINEITEDRDYYQTNGLGNINFLPKLAYIRNFELRPLNERIPFHADTDDINVLLRKLIDIKKEQIVLYIFIKYVYWILSRDDRFFNLAQQRIHEYVKPNMFYTMYHTGGQEFLISYKHALAADINTAIAELSDTHSAAVFIDYIKVEYKQYAGLDLTDPANITSYIDRKSTLLVVGYARRNGSMLLFINDPNISEVNYIEDFKTSLYNILCMYILKYVKTANASGLIGDSNVVNIPGLEDYPLNIRVIQFAMNNAGLDWREEVKAHGVPISDKPILPRVIKGKHTDIEGEGWD